MKLRIDGRITEPCPGQSLLDLVKDLGLDTQRLSTRPLAAKIAGEVFTLNYIPVRQSEASEERSSIRRAMAASVDRSIYYALQTLQDGMCIRGRRSL